MRTRFLTCGALANGQRFSPITAFSSHCLVCSETVLVSRWGGVCHSKSLCELFLKSIQVYGCESKPLEFKRPSEQQTAFISFKSSILNQMNQRQSGRVFNFFQHKTRLRILHAVVRKQRIQNKMGKRVHIGKKGMEQIVGFTR